MNPERPQISHDPMYQLLRMDNVEEFNHRKAAGESCDLSGKDFRGLDMRGLDADGLDFSNSYFRQTDLRGVNLSQCNLEGASLNGANISGAYLPPELPADEIMMSVKYGTRMRYR
jgi:uncharacterized protein YjbI with pentapeptide repeats